MTTPRKRHKAVSHSAREQFKGCNKSYFFQRVMRLEPLQKKTSLRMGTAFGLCVEHRDPERAYEGYWDGTPLHERIQDRQAELEIAQVKLLAELYCERYQDHQTYDHVEHETEFKSKVLGHGFLDGVFERPKIDNNHGLSNFQNTIYRTERVGMEGKLLQKGLFWNETSRLVLAIDDQVTAYFAAMREIGRPLDKLLYRVTFKPGITQNSKINETLPQYLERLRKRIADDPSYAFEDHVLYRTDAQLDRFLEECNDVNQQIKLATRSGAWPKSTKNCTAFGGCVFLPVCREEPSAPSLYRVRPEPVKPKLPRLGKVQKAVLLALGDAFISPTSTPALAKRVAYEQGSVASALKSLQDRGFIADDGVIEGETYWDVMPEGRQVVKLLRGDA